MWILSIDIGTKNCAFYIEEKGPGEINNLYKSGKCIYWDLADFTTESCDIYVNVILYLNKYQNLWSKCSGIIIEKQLKINFKAQQIEHFIFSYFKVRYGPFKYIIKFAPTYKTQILDAPKGMNKIQRKQWAVLQAEQICKIRNDYKNLNFFNRNKKKDDLADALIQLKAFIKLVFIDKKIP